MTYIVVAIMQIHYRRAGSSRARGRSTREYLSCVQFERQHRYQAIYVNRSLIEQQSNSRTPRDADHAAVESSLSPASSRGPIVSPAEIYERTPLCARTISRIILLKISRQKPDLTLIDFRKMYASRNRHRRSLLFAEAGLACTEQPNYRHNECLIGGAESRDRHTQLLYAYMYRNWSAWLCEVVVLRGATSVVLAHLKMRHALCLECIAPAARHDVLNLYNTREHCWFLNIIKPNMMPTELRYREDMQRLMTNSCCFPSSPQGVPNCAS